MSDTSHNANAGVPTRLPADPPADAAPPPGATTPGIHRPSAAELDARDRDKARPRRAAGPPLVPTPGIAPGAAAPPPDPATATDP